MAYIAARTGKTIRETGDMTRVEAGLIYTALREQEIREAAQQALFNLPGFEAAGIMAIGTKKSTKQANDIIRNAHKELTKISYGERK